MDGARDLRVSPANGANGVPAAETVPRAPLRAIGVSIVTGISCAGVMFAYNLPGALAHGLEQDYQVTAGDVASLMTAYTIPSTITAMIAAEALALLGLNSISVICSAVLQLGTLCFALAPTMMPSRPIGVMLGAQLINGAGDPLGLACSPAMVARWWRHNHSGLAMGTTLMVTQLLGAMLPFILLPRIRSSMGTGAALWVGVFAQATSCVFMALYVFLEFYYAKYLAVVDSVDATDADTSCSSDNDQKGHRSGLAACRTRLKGIPVDAWLQIIAVCLIPVTQYVALGLLPVYLSSVHGMSEVEAGDCASLVWWFCVTAPLWGMLADSPSFGRLHIQLVGSSIAALCFFLLHSGFSDLFGFGPILVVMGLSFAMVDQNAYVCVEALVPDPRLIDFTYGVMGAVFNVGMGFISHVAGSISPGQMPLLYVTSLGVGIALTVALLLRIPTEEGVQKGLLPRSSAKVSASSSSGPHLEVVYGRGEDALDDVELAPLTKHKGDTASAELQRHVSQSGMA